MYDSPIEFCSVCRGYVALDQAQTACALEQKCQRDASGCPLASLFVSRPPAMPVGDDVKAEGGQVGLSRPSTNCAGG